MSYKQKKHYPDMGLVRRKAKSVCKAIEALVEKGIEVQAINFNSAIPVIDIANCPGNESLRGVAIGRSQQSDNDLHIKKTAHVCGCQVIWSEAV